MSWLNLNDSLSSLKGQITNFANNVLADDVAESSPTNELDELRKLCAKQQDEINNLKRINDELNSGARLKQNTDNQQLNNWSWEIPENNVPNLKTKLEQIENEKNELEKNLELLDYDHQQNTERIVAIKDKLQYDYNELEDKFTELQNSYKILQDKESDNKNEFSQLKTKYNNLLKTLSSESSQNQTTDIECEKCCDLLKSNQKLQSDYETVKNEISVITNNNSTISKILEDLKNATNKEIENFVDKVKLLESENRLLIGELKKANEKIDEYERRKEIDEENCKKLARILEEYEKQVSCLKDELAKTKNNDFETIKIELEQVRIEKESLHRKYVNIITDNMKKYVDCAKLSDFQHYSIESDPQISEFSNQVENLLKILLDFKFKCENLEGDLYNITQEKTKLLTEKNHEIEKLLQNSEILSQEVITKSQTIKDLENECNELMKNNDLLINELEGYKNNSGLQTISETNEDNVLLLESQLEVANKKIEDLEKNDNVREIDNLKEEIQLLEGDKEILIDEKDELNGIIDRMRSDLENTEYQYSEMNVNVDMLKEEIVNQKARIDELIEQNKRLEKLNAKIERNNENIGSELNVIRDKCLIEEQLKKQREDEIRFLNEKLQNAKMSETKLKLQNDKLHDGKTIVESNLMKQLRDLEQVQKQFYNIQQENDELKLEILKDREIINQFQGSEERIDNDESPKKDVQNVEMIEDLTKENSDLKSELNSITTEKNHLQIQLDQFNALSEQIPHLEKTIEELNSAKNELANIIISKHQENVTYHNEIQRLSQILSAELEKNRNFEMQLHQIKSVQIDSEDVKRKDEDMEKLLDQNHFLKEKCDILTKNLLQEQNKLQTILNENNQSEKELQLSKKLERLQNHLIEVEEHYTQELLRAEEKNQELQGKVNEIEQREKNSSTMYTSVSIRANQHVETLQNQLQMITNQRDELRKKISDAEDNAGKQAAALANLQFVLEKVQKDKEAAIQHETNRIRKQINVEKQIQDELKGEIGNLHVQLDESKQGLQAASRLSDQLEYSKQLVATLKEEISQMKDKLGKSEDALKQLSNHTDGKVDKSLIKNLVIGFVTSNNNLNKDQSQILKIIATVLDFNQQDHDKINLNKAQNSWLGSFLPPQSSQNMSHESLSQAFVKFLENESKPRVLPSLLSNEVKRNTSSTPPRQSPIVLSEIVLPTFADFAQNRNSSSILKDVLKDSS